MISESTYRQLSDQLNLKPIEFNIGEAVYNPTDSERKSPLLEVLNSPLTIIGEGDSRITALLYDDVYVVKDVLYNKISGKDESSAIYIYQVEDWAKSLLSIRQV